MERDGGVVVRLRESGFSRLAGGDAVGRRARDANVEGWCTQLERLQAAVAGVVV